MLPSSQSVTVFTFSHTNTQISNLANNIFAKTDNQNTILKKWFNQPCKIPSLLSLSLSLCFYLFIYLLTRIMFHLVFAASVALALFCCSYCLRAKGKWRILSVQTLMLQKGFQPHQLSSHATNLSV